MDLKEIVFNSGNPCGVSRLLYNFSLKLMFKTTHSLYNDVRHVKHANVINKSTIILLGKGMTYFNFETRCDIVSPSLSDI